MTTNYYIRTEPCEDACAHCSAALEIHLGQSAIGWAFCFQAFDGDDSTVNWPVSDWDSWLRLLDLGSIYDEYGKQVPREDLLTLIEHKRGLCCELSRDDFLDEDGNHFIRGDFT